MENLPGLSNNERRYFLGIANGKITYRPGKDQPTQTFDAFEGKLLNIKKREATINGGATLFYDFTLTAGGYTYVLSIPMSSSVARSVILSIASVEKPRGASFKFSPYLKTITKAGQPSNVTNVSVYCNGEKTSWVIESLPPVKQVAIGSKVVIDDSERVAVVESYVGIINKRLEEVFDEETGMVNDPEVDFEAPMPTEEFPENLG